VRRALRLPWRELARDLGSSDPRPTFAGSSRDGIDLEDLYRGQTPGWRGLQRAAGFVNEAPDEFDSLCSAGCDAFFMSTMGTAAQIRSVATPGFEPSASSSVDERARRLRAMLHFSLWARTSQSRRRTRVRAASAVRSA